MIYFPKSQPAPPCLAAEKVKANGTYNCEEVLARINEDFKNKCYLCENKEPHSINTEHFRPHRGNSDLKFDWNNLFFCCAHCNNIKLARHEFDNILNCTDPDDNVEEKIKYAINPFPKEKALINSVEDNPRVDSTVNLLREIFNGTTPLKIIESANLRSSILKEIRTFQNMLFRYYDDAFTPEEKEDIKNEIIRELRAASNFTSFKRWIIRNNQALLDDFQLYLAL